MIDEVLTEQDKVIIKGREYRLGHNLHSQVLYEHLMKEMGKGTSPTLEIIVLFYSILLALNGESFKMAFDEFFDYLNDNQKIFVDFQNWSSAYFRKREILFSSNQENGKKKD